MILFRKSITALVGVVALSLFFTNITLSFMTGFASAQASATHPAHGKDFKSDFEIQFRNGQEAAMNMRRRYVKTVRLWASAAAVVIAVPVAFSGVFPWCRRKPRPPPLPPSS